MTRPTVKSLITQDLGYCCLWFFFTHNRQTALVAERLGVSTRAIRYAKAEALSSCHCDEKANCMNRLITRSGDLRKIRLPASTASE